MDAKHANPWGIDWDDQSLKEKVENASTEVQVVVSLGEPVRNFESEKDGVKSGSTTTDHHTDESGNG